MVQKNKNQLNRYKLAAYLITLIALGVGIGWAAETMFKDYTPESVVLVADESVNAPKDLLRFLEKEAKDDCHDYRGTNTEKGVAIYSVYEVVNDKYARIALGCSTNLSSGFPVVKTDDGWKLISAAAYYVHLANESTEEGPLPYARCSVVDKYQISKEFEDVCLEDKGEANPELSAEDFRIVTYE